MMKATMRQLASAAVWAWLVTLLAGFAGGAALVHARNPESVGEFAFAYLLVMSVPFALAVGCVLLPVMSLARIIAGPGQTWLLAGTGVLVAPLEAISLLGGGTALFGGPRAEPSADTWILLAAFAAGGVVLGVLARNAEPAAARTSLPSVPASPC